MGACLSHIIDGSSSTHEYDCVPCCGEYDPSPRRRSKFKGKQRKKRVMEILAAEARSNEILYRTVGRMCSNGSTSNACVFTQQGRKGINQDAMIVWENFDSSCANTTFCGVFDGHGPFGHLVARKVRDALPSKISALKLADERNTIAVSGYASAPTTELSSVLEEQQHQKWFTAWRDCFTRAYHSMDKELKSHPTIDSFCSGTTAVTMLLQGRDMLVANVGDSRAVLGTLSVDDDSRVEAVQLTVDLKPNLPLEAERIKRCKGRVFALEDEPEVARVWLPHDDSPGLAMARAFGDFCLKDFGLIAVPEVTYARVTERDQFVVLASDGIWDVLSNKEVVETIWEAPTRTTAARALVETAVRAWRLKYPTSKVDDCAVVCYFFNKQQQRRKDLPDMVVSASSSSGSSAMEELDIVNNNIDHLQVDLPITKALSPAAAVMDITVDHELVLPQSKYHENNFCASATSASLQEVATCVGAQGNHTEREGQKMTAGSAKTDSMAGVDFHQEPLAVSSSPLAAMDKALHMTSENDNQSINCEQGEGVMQRSETLRSANADAISIISPLSLSSADESSFESDSPQEDGKSFVTIAGPELLLDIGENGVHHNNVLYEETISAQLNNSSSHMSDESLTSMESRAENTSSLGSPPPKDWSLCPKTDQHAAESSSNNRLGSSPPGVCSLAPESDRYIAINNRSKVDDVRIQTVQEAVSSQLHHSQIDTEIMQSSATTNQETTSAFTMEFTAASRFLPEFEGAPSEITVMTEEEGDTGKASPFLARSASRRSLAECLSVADDEEWSALEGVARVNSLLNLPRFLQRGRSEIIRRANSRSSQSIEAKKRKKKKKETPWKLLSWKLLSFKRIAQKMSAGNKSKEKKKKEKEKIGFEEGAEEEQIGIWY